MNSMMNSVLMDMKYDFRRVSIEEIIKIRLSKKSGTIIKSNEVFYYTEKIVKADTFFSHLCGNCAFVYACSHKKGGCEKVADFFLDSMRKYTRSFKVAVRESKRIEKYSWIEEGMERFSPTENDIFVYKCNRFKKK